MTPETLAMCALGGMGDLVAGDPTRTDWFDKAFDGQTLMGILRGYALEETVRLARTAWELGVTCVEVPVQNDQAIASLRATITAGRLWGSRDAGATACSGRGTRRCRPSRRRPASTRVPAPDSPSRRRDQRVAGLSRSSSTSRIVGN